MKGNVVGGAELLEDAASRGSRSRRRRGDGEFSVVCVVKKKQGGGGLPSLKFFPRRFSRKRRPGCVVCREYSFKIPRCCSFVFQVSLVQKHGAAPVVLDTGALLKGAPSD